MFSNYPIVLSDNVLSLKQHFQKDAKRKYKVNEKIRKDVGKCLFFSKTVLQKRKQFGLREADFIKPFDLLNYLLKRCFSYLKSKKEKVKLFVNVLIKNGRILLLSCICPRIEIVIRLNSSKQTKRNYIYLPNTTV